MAKITAMEVGQPLAEDGIEFEELPEMDSFAATAKAFFKNDEC
jgi:hypothetical protein